MNRNEEFIQLMKELEEHTPDLQQAVWKARKRKMRKQMIYRPLGCVAAVFALFVLSVNLWVPVAQACSKIPFLRELAEAVTFSRSLSDAVENEYVQEMNLTQTKNGVTAEVAYLIVDQKQVNIFYRLDSENDMRLAMDFEVMNADGEKLEGYGASWGDYDTPKGELYSVRMDFVNGNVPSEMRIRMDVYEYAEEADYLDKEKRHYVAEFEFLLEFDPTYTAAGQMFTLNQTVELDGQKITITNIEVYPTHMRVHVTDDEENTSWLEGLEFYVETEDGVQFGDSVGFVSGFGELKTEGRVIYYAESPYFHDAKELKFVIKGAEFLDKELEKVRVDLKNQKADRLPEGMVLKEIRNEGETVIVAFSCLFKETGRRKSQLFDMVYYDKDGTKYSMYSSSFGSETRENGEIYEMQEVFLENYPYDEVWLVPGASHIWTAEEEIVIKIK